MVRISAVSGALVGRVTVGAGWQVLAAAWNRLQNRLYAIARDSDGDRRLVHISSTTGTVTVLGALLPADLGLVPGAHGLHPRRGQWHVLGDDGSGQRLLTFSLAAGSVLANVPVAGYALANLHFDEGSGRLLAQGRQEGANETRLLWINPGTGQVTGLSTSGTADCCAFTAGALVDIASDDVAGSHLFNSPGPAFLAWDVALGNAVGSVPHPRAWAIHGIVADQNVFVGDHILYDGFEVVSKPGSDTVFQ